jgi:hypothetical protein
LFASFSATLKLAQRLRLIIFQFFEFPPLDDKKEWSATHANGSCEKNCQS